MAIICHGHKNNMPDDSRGKSDKTQQKPFWKKLTAIHAKFNLECKCNIIYQFSFLPKGVRHEF